MDSQRLHVRSTVVVDEALLKQFPEVDAEFELLVPNGQEGRIVANRIVVDGGSLEGYRLALIGEIISGLGPGIDAKLVNHTAPDHFVGRPGLPMNVVAKRLLGGSARSIGQRGGNNFPGFGLRGGDGGPVEIVLREPSTVTDQWFGQGGEGSGGPIVNGNRGDDVPATVRVVDLPGFRTAIAKHLVLGDWLRLREALAIEEFRHGHLSSALQELREATDLAGAQGHIDLLAPHLAVLVRDNRTITGVARDADLVPDIVEHAQVHADRAAALADVLPASGPLSGDAVARLLALQDRLGDMLDPGGDFTVQENDLKGSIDRALKIINAMAKRASRVDKRLSTLLTGSPGQPVDPAVTAAGVSLTAPVIAAALMTVLGPKAPGVIAAPADGTVIWPDSPTQPFAFQPAGDQATVLPFDLDLLVHRSLRNKGETLFTNDVASLRNGAAGLARLAEWNRVATGQPGADGKPVVVSLAKIAKELRAAVGNRAVLDLLIELTEVSHVWRLARARMEQLLAARATLELARARAKAARDKPIFFPSLIGPADLLPAVRCLLDGLQWFADRADRASALLTFGLFDPPVPFLDHYPQPLPPTQNLAALLPVLHSPDREKDLEEESPGALSSQTFDAIITAVRTRDTKKPYDTYLAQRGIPIVGQSPPPLHKVFTLAERPDVIQRFAETGEFWFDASLADLAGEAGASPHAEARVVGVKVALEFVVAGPGVDVPLQVTHTGISTQRDLEKREHRQAMLPATIDVNVLADDDALYEGETSLNAPNQPPIKPINFPIYGRGAVASWQVQRSETITVLPDLQAITVDILYEGMVPKGTASLRSVAFAGAGLRVGGEAVLTVALTGPAGAGGVKVELSSSDPSTLSGPTSVLVAAGKTVTTALLKVLKPTGAHPPTLTAKTADGVARQARPKVPTPIRASISSVHLVPAGQSGSIAAVAVVPATTAKTPGRVLATVSPPVGPVENPEPDAVIHERRPDTLAAVRSAKVGRQPRSLAVDAKRRRIYVANNGSSSVSMLDADSLKTLAERTVGLHVDVEVDPVAGLVYVSLFGAAKIVILSADDLTVRGEVVDPVRLRRPHGMAVFPGAGSEAMIYVARTVRGIPNQSEESAVSQIRRTANGTHTLVRTLDLGPVLTQPVDVAVDTVHKLIFVSCLGGNDVAPCLVVLEHPTMKELHRIPLFSGGRAVESRSGSGLAYVAGEAGLTIADGRAGVVTTRFPLGDVHLDEGLPFSVAVDQVTGTAYVGTRDRATLFRIDAPTEAGRVFW